MTCKPRILLLTCEFPPYRGGAGTYSRDLAVGLADNGAEVEVAASAGPTGLNVEQCIHPGVTVLPLRWKTGHWPAIPLSALQRQPDLIIATERMAVETLSFLDCFETPVIVVCHGSEVLRYWSHATCCEPPWLCQQVKRFYTRCQAIVCVSNATRDLLLSALADLEPRVHVIPNGIDVRRIAGRNQESIEFLPAKESLAVVPERAKVVLSVGRLAEDKGQDKLILAFREICETFPDAHLVLVGQGPNQDELEDLVVWLRLRGRVHIVSDAGDAELACWYQRAVVFALISQSRTRFEGFGLVFLEANYFSLAGIGAKTGGVPEAISHGYSGLLVPPGDTTAIAETLRQLLSDEELRTRLGRQAKLRLHEHFTAERMGRQMLDLVQSVIDNARRPTRRESLGIRMFQRLRVATLYAKACFRPENRWMRVLPSLPKRTFG